MTFAYRSCFVGLGLGFWVACTPTKPGAHVELVHKGGQSVYVSGAAGPGISRSIACRAAIQRSVAAIAQRFAYENRQIGAKIAKEVGASDGEVFLHGYAKEDALRAAVQDVQFDPSQHLCMATVRWTPPVFVKEAVTKFAHAMRTAEGETPVASEKEVSAPDANVQSTPPAPIQDVPQAYPPPPVQAPQDTRSGVAKAGASNSVSSCSAPRRQLKKTLAAGQKAVDDFDECLRRTKNDETICHRYKLYVEEATKKESAAGLSLVACLNADLPSKVRVALNRGLSGHAARVIETRGTGSLLLWTFSPAEQTGYAAEIDPEGLLSNKEPLNAEQLAWIRGRLGL